MGAIRLSRQSRGTFYFVFALLFLSGIVWAWLNYVPLLPEEKAQWWKSNSLKAHGAAAMASLIVIGTFLTRHVPNAWRARRNRVNGIFLISILGLLVVTGYGLYYFGDEVLRSWTSQVHLWIGIAFPLILLAHIFLGRRSR